MLVQARDFRVIEISGTKARALCDRMLTNQTPQPGFGTLTFLLAHQGRIEGGAYLVSLEENRFLAFGGRELVDGLAEGLIKYKLRDDVSIQVLKSRAVYVGDASVLSSALAPDPWPAESLAKVDGSAGAQSCLVLAGPGWFGKTVWVVADSAGAVAQATGVQPSEADWDAAQRARIAAGWPELGYEVKLGDLPLEWDLGWAFALKGCYVGQEVIERMWTRGRRNRGRTLIGIDDSVIDGADIRRPDWLAGDALGLRHARGSTQWSAQAQHLPQSLRLGFDGWVRATVGEPRG